MMIGLMRRMRLVGWLRVRFRLEGGLQWFEDMRMVRGTAGTRSL